MLSLVKSLIKTCILTCIVVAVVSCDSGNRHEGNLGFFIPENSMVVLRTNSLADLSSDFKNNSLLSKTTNALWTDQLSNRLAYLENLQLLGTSYICLSIRKDTLYDFTLITKQHPNLLVTDSLDSISAPPINLNTLGLSSFTIGNATYYSALIDSVLVSSSNQSIVAKAQEQKIFAAAPQLKKLLTALPETMPALFINNQGDRGVLNEFFNGVPLASSPLNPWTGLSFKVLPGELSFNGVTMTADSTETLHSAFKNTIPQKLNFQTVVPKDASGVIALSYDSFDLYNAQHSGNTQSLDSMQITRAFMSSTLGTTLVYGAESPSLVFEPVDLEISLDLLTPALETLEDFKGVTLYTLGQNLPVNAMLAPFADSLKTKDNVVFVIDDQILVCKNNQIAQNIISQFVTNNTLANSNMYTDAKASLQEAASITMIALQPAFRQKLLSWSSNSTIKAIETLDFSKYPLGIVQFEAQGSFTHINGLFKETGSTQSGTGIKELVAINHSTPIINGPHFFTNHRSGGKDIVFQDANNKLLLHAANGTKLWEKQLDGPILGIIDEVDLLRNRKKQLAFTTASTFYILDRNGREVAPFPIKFKDEVTQPLAVFDYDNNRKYRFVITQGDQILMYDSKAKIVKGFTFTKAQAPLVYAPKHFRMGNKDYLVFAQSNGKLSIKSRVGKDRVTVNKTFNFGAIAPLAEDGSFVVITKDNTKETISTSGRVSSKNLGVSNDFALSIVGKTKVSLDDNLLRINGRLIELPFGIYSAPNIYSHRRTIFIALTDTQTNKLYVYNTSGELLPNFPIFATGSASLGDANNNRNLNILAPSEDNGMLLYELR